MFQKEEKNHLELGMHYIQQEITLMNHSQLSQQMISMDDPMDAVPVDENGMPVTAEAPEEQPEIQITFRRDHEKIGRNDPCPCGSGKKFKKCCGK